MRVLTAILLMTALSLPGCGAVRDSRLNPGNWFDGERAERREARRAGREAQEARNPLLPEERRRGVLSGLREQAAEYQGTPVDQVTNAVIETVPGGAILRVEGLSAVDNVYDVRLSPVNEDDEVKDGILAYRIEGVKPARPTQRTSQRQRRVTVARRLTDTQLAEAREIQIIAARNIQRIRRR